MKMIKCLESEEDWVSVHRKVGGEMQEQGQEDFGRMSGQKCLVLDLNCNIQICVDGAWEIWTFSRVSLNHAHAMPASYSQVPKW